MVGFTTNDVRNAVVANNKEWLGEALDRLGYKDKDSRPAFTSVDQTFMSALFGTAAITAQNDTLDRSIIELLIERTLPAIDLFDLIKLYLLAQGVEEVDYGLIPEDVKQHLKDNKYTEEIGAIIQEMNNNEIDAVLSFIFKETETIKRSFTYPIVRNIYKHGIIPDAQLVMIMGFSLEEPESGEMLSGLDGLLALSALGCLF